MKNIIVMQDIKSILKLEKKKYFLISNLVTALEKKCKQKQKNWVAT